MLTPALEIRDRIRAARELKQYIHLREFIIPINQRFGAAAVNAESEIEINLNYLTVGQDGMRQLQQLLTSKGYGSQLRFLGANVANFKIWV